MITLQLFKMERVHYKASSPLTNKLISVAKILATVKARTQAAHMGFQH